MANVPAVSVPSAPRSRSGEAQLGAGIPRGLVWLLAAATGASAANLYYAQPLLDTLRGAFSVSDATIGLIVTIAQIGYVLGLALLVPLGDLRERRSLIVVTMLFSAAGMVALAATLRRVLPSVAPTTELRYAQVLRSVLALVRDEPVLRHRMLLGALSFGCFSTLWTALSFLLSAPPFHYGNAVIGLFGLAGVAGAGAASVVGRLADRGHGAVATTTTLVVMTLSFGVLYVARHSAAGLIVGILLLDLGVQGAHISNQHAIYSLAPEARSRLTTAYMVSYFAGGATLSAVTSALYSSAGWAGVCVIGGATGLASVLVWAVGGRRLRTAAGS
jgi:predicted MFS family arabinose efflux permease